MPTVKVSIPYNESNIEKRLGWEYEASAALDAGNDIQFVDDIDGVTERNVAQIGLFNETSGAVKSRGVGMTDAQATTKKFAAGGYHIEAISFIYASGTDSSLGIHVRMA